MTKRYLNVAYKDREFAKKLGAKWDPSVRRWYCPAGSPLAKIFAWRKAERIADPVIVASRAKTAVNQNFELPLAS